MLLMQQLSPTVREYCIQRRYSERVIEEGLPYLVGKWERVAERATDYSGWYLDDYLNDLDGRQVLFDIFTFATGVELAEAKHRVKVADAKFIANSVDTLDCVWGLSAEAKYQYTKQRNWWYYRMPIQIGPHWNSPHGT